MTLKSDHCAPGMCGHQIILFVSKWHRNFNSSLSVTVFSCALYVCFCINHCPPMQVSRGRPRKRPSRSQTYTFCSAPPPRLHSISFTLTCFSFYKQSFLSDLWCTSHLSTFWWPPQFCETLTPSLLSINLPNCWAVNDRALVHLIYP